MPSTTRLLSRHAQGAVEAALADTRVVVVLGARQVGKSTLLEQVAAAEGSGRRVITLDDQATRAAAIDDPTGFIAGLETPVAIDEIQRAPELMTEIKLRVDRDAAPGQFAITGSANLLEMKQVKDSLAGRAEYLRLHPFSQGELRGRRESFIPDLLDGRSPDVTGAAVGRKAYAELLARGGYPEIQRRASNRRPRFFESYVEGILDRDLATLADVADRAAVARLLQAIGATSAGELNIERLSDSLGAPATTIRRHVDLLETLFLVRRLPAWSNNLLARTIKRPKIHVADTGLLAYLVGADERRIETDLDLGGMFFETFVADELHRQVSWLDDRPTLFHFRDRDQREVDIVIERRDGSVAAVEVKSTATVRASDFRGLAHLRDKLGSRFKAGVLLHAGANTVPFGDRLAAVPLAGLWGT
ncbi:MAG: ATP-binding protein [Solirubrobacterales bacterium]|nr:ATP-binding protein [Solirubrobacterales bacterium]